MWRHAGRRGMQEAKRRALPPPLFLLPLSALLLLLGPRRAFVALEATAGRLGLHQAKAAADTAELRIRSSDYWEHRYRTRDALGQGEHVDDRGMGWYCEYAGPLQQTLQAVLAGERGSRILNVGCGVDRLAADIYFDGFTNLLSTDISPAAIQEMAATTKASMPDAEWQVDDVLAMNVPSGTVDAVVDKGTLDAVMLAPELFTNAAKMLREVQRVLRVGGTYIVVTHGRGDPKSSRVPLLQLPHLAFNVQVTPDLGGFFLLVAQKVRDLTEEEELKRWGEVEAWAADMDRQDAAVEATSMGAQPSSEAGSEAQAEQTLEARRKEAEREAELEAQRAEWERIEELGQ